ncbi:Lsr2 family DNA-binding protein [Streptomyces prunicolor]
MFTDMKEALEAEALELTPLGSGQSAAASLVVAHQGGDKDDLADLLGALGLPCGEDDLVRLLPHLTTAVDTPKTGVPMPVNAFTATAVSMLNNGDSPEHVSEILGLSDDELADAVQQAEALPQNTARPGQPVPGTGIEALLGWGEQHTAKGVQALAAKARTALAELAGRRETEQAIAGAEDRVARLARELAQAKEDLKEAKTGKPATDAVTDTVPKGVATANLPASGQGASGRRSKEELAAIRTWARANGHEVADRGTPAQKVIDAYYTAQTMLVGADS